ncbi:hypothetical protein BOTCAL_0007g00170 [Botryotinia calthae]|uniref:Uncharacterized protein n=1 Tax=Botryotinia calthae TaxID=38488 RepID=A0A4Y8DH16_9HELO|nr:hypothetical protein BOTCAL_0007g00170 [Botryotinia calthae]
MTSTGLGELSRGVLLGGLVVNGTFIPEDMVADTSGPEIWILNEVQGVNSEDVTEASSTLYPFSCGAADCAGQKSGYVENVYSNRQDTVSCASQQARWRHHRQKISKLWKGENKSKLILVEKCLRREEGGADGPIQEANTIISHCTCIHLGC